MIFMNQLSAIRLTLVVFCVLAVLPSVVNSVGQTKIYVDSSSTNSTNDSSCWTGGDERPCSSLDLGLLGLSHFLSRVHVIVRPGQYNFNSNELGNFYGLTNVVISGDTSESFEGSVAVTCSNNSQAGFSFENSTNITISGLRFDGCQQVRNSTSIGKSNQTFEQFNVTLYFLYCTNVELYEISVVNIAGTGLILYNCVGNIVLNTCVFENCHNGGVYIEYSYCVPTIGGTDCLQSGVSNVNSDFTSNGTISVSNSKFINNIANVLSSLQDSDTFILPHKQFHSAFGRGGGVSVFFKGNASYNNVSIENCTFKNNTALWGGGIFAEFQDSVGHNTFYVSSCYIEHNRVASVHTNQSPLVTGGGGSRVGFIHFDNYEAYTYTGNEIIFDNCTFEHNEALFGGGLSLYAARQLQNLHHQHKNSFAIRNSNFNHNKARLGSAVDLSAWHSSINGEVFMPFIENCNFFDNSPHDNFERVGVGAVYIDALRAVFNGDTVFRFNHGSALAITGEYLTVEKNSSLLFENNSGRNGGGIALLGNTFVLTNQNSSLTFVNNSADYQGGAIYFYSSGQRDLISSHSCMMRYSDITVSPSEWNVSFTFIGNTASGENNSIFASSVLSCLWGGAYGNISSSTLKVFCWNNWIYYDTNGMEVSNSNCTSQISSAPSNFTDVAASKYETPLIPGDVPINLSSLLEISDDLGDKSVSKSAIYIATVINSSDGSNYRFESNESYNYVSHNNLYLYANENTTLFVKFETLDPIVVQKHVKFEFQNCPPGFKISNYSCVCAGSYGNYLTCVTSKYHSKLSRGAWIGVYKGTNTLLVGLSPYVHVATSEAALTLPNTSNSLDHKLCHHLNRTGRLCGECQPNYCIAVNDEDFKCIKCSDSSFKWNWSLYLLTEFFPVTIFFIAVLVFSMTVNSGPLNAYIFFAQIINSVARINADGSIPLENAFLSTVSYKIVKLLYVIPYNIWNLDFKAIFPIEYCLGKDLNTLQLLSLQYLTVLYPLLLLIVFIAILVLYNRGSSVIVYMFRPLHDCLSRVKQSTGLTQSIPGGIAVFIVVTYTKFALISNLLLSGIPLYDHDGKVKMRVFYYDGSLEYPHEGKIYISFALMVIAIFVAIPPILLIYPSFLELLRRLLKNRINLSRLYPSHKIQVFLNEFHGCYKDGSNGGIDCRWFAGLYFCLRIILFTMYSQTDDWSSQYLAQLMLFLLMAILFCSLRPYRADWINTLDSFIFANLAGISGICLFNLQSARLGKNLNKGVFIFLLFLVFLPLVYCIYYYLNVFIFPVIVLYYQRAKKYFYQLSVRSGTSEELYTTVNADEVNSDAEDDSTHRDSFLEYVGNRHRTTDSSRRFFSWRKTNSQREGRIENSNSRNVNRNSRNEESRSMSSNLSCNYFLLPRSGSSSDSATTSKTSTSSIT